MIHDIPKPDISPDFTIEDIHKLREWHYECRKGMSVQEVISHINKRGNEFEAIPFLDKGIPEIKDFHVFKKFQRRGIGAVMMDKIENIAAGVADTVCLGVGLHSGYGTAQRMYVKRGYVFDGSGVWDGSTPAKPYGMVENGDDLVLYMSKKLR